MGGILKCLVLKLLALCLLASAAAAGDLVEVGTLDALDLADIALLVPDREGLTVHDLAAMVAGGEPLSADTPGDAEPAWMAVRLLNATGVADWTFVLRQAFYRRIDLWVLDGASVLSHQVAGMAVPDRAAQPRFALGYTLPIVLPRAQERILVLRLEPILFATAPPLLQSAEAARIDSGQRRLLFPLLFGIYLGIGAIHIVVFLRFGDIANLLFTGTVLSIFLDWFVWLGGLQDLGFVPTVGTIARMSTFTWFTATFLITSFCVSFLAGRYSARSIAGFTAVFALFLLAYALTASIELQLFYVDLLLLTSAAFVLVHGALAVARRLAGAWLVVAGYMTGLFDQLSAYLGVSLPPLAAFNEMMKDSVGHFDLGTVLLQIPMFALFSLGLWERVRAMLRERDAVLHGERLKAVRMAQLGHDIRSPLHAVQSLIGALTAPGGVDPGQVQALQSSVRSVVAMLDDMVDLARTGDVSRRSGVVDIHELLAAAIAAGRAEPATRGVEFHLSIAEDVPMRMSGNATAIRRVLGNLLSNAARATTGPVVVAASRSGARGGSLRFEVSDTGPGMSREHLARLLEPAGTSARGSTGLGLEITRHLVDALGGRLGASSRRGKGTTIWFEIPARAVPEPAAGGPSTELDAVGPLRLLLVEDDDLTAQATGMLLAAGGHEIRRARNASEAVDLAARTPLDLILMDIGLDAQSGLEAIRAIRSFKDPVAAAVPIVIVTGERSAVDLAARGALGIQSVLIKPFGDEELRRAIAGSLGLEGGTLRAEPGGSSFLADLTAMLSPARASELFETGRRQIAANLEALEAALEADTEDMRRCAHRLGGSAATLGFRGLAQAARAAEDAARAGDRAAVAAAMDEVRKAAGDVLAELDRRLARPEAPPE